METAFDIIVIGSGPGGYTAAIRASQLGYKTAIVEKYSVLGGACTNVGCIPSKALLDGTELYDMILHKTAKQGISTGTVQLDFTTLIQRKSNVVKQNTDGLNYLMKKNKIEIIRGTAAFINSKSIAVNDSSGATKSFEARYFIIATGSKPATIPGVVIDKVRIISSTEALSLKEKPNSMVIIGGGVIGVEMASIYKRIDVDVKIIEYADRLVPAMDKELSKELYKVLSKTGIEIHLNSKVQSAVNNGNQAEVVYLDEAGTKQTVVADYCLVATGRRPYTTGLALENTKVQIDGKGMITVNNKLQTHEENIYAIGDVIRGAMLAHKAEDEGVFVAETINGKSPHIKYGRIPSVVYTWPELASVGYTEEELIAQGTVFNKGKFPFSANAKARAADDTEGFVKVLVDPKYGEIFGVHVISARASDLIMQGVLAMEFELTDIELGKISYAHPTFSEAFKDAYLMASGRGAINI